MLVPFKFSKRYIELPRHAEQVETESDGFPASAPSHALENAAFAAAGIILGAFGALALFWLLSAISG